MVKVTEGFEVITYLHLFFIHCRLTLQHVFLANKVKDKVDACRTFAAGLVEKQPKLFGLKGIFYNIPFHGYFLLLQPDFAVILRIEVGFVQQESLN